MPLYNNEVLAMTHDWFIVRDGMEQGPFTAQQLKQMAATGKLQPDDKVRRSDMQAASKASKIKGLFNTEPKPTTPSSAQPSTKSPPATSKKFGIPKKTLIMLSVVGGVCLFMCCGGMVFIGHRAGEAHKKELAEADSLWQSGKKAEAVAIYRTKQKSAFLEGNDRAVVYGRLIDFEFENGNVEAGKNLIDEAEKKGFTPSATHADAKTLMAEKQAAKQAGSSAQATKKTEAAPVKTLTLADGRVPIDQFIEHLKRTEKLVLHTPKEGSDPSGTPLERFSQVLGEKCRVHIGGREDFGQNVSAILVETVKDRQLAAVMLGTPFDLSRSPTRGNELTSIIAFVRSILPEADIRKMVGEEGVRLAYGNDSQPKAHGKAAISISYNKSAKEFQVTIIAEPTQPQAKNDSALPAKDAEGWKGGTIADFISRMNQFARQDWPKVGWLTFDPAAGRARTLARSETEFFKRFGKPIENVVDKKKADMSAFPKKDSYRERFRLWTYRCTDGTVTLHVEPTSIQPPSGQGDLLEVLDINIGPGDCVKK